MILKNFMIKKGKSYEGYPEIKLIESEFVFVNMSICQINMEDIEDTNGLYVIDIHPQTNIARIVARERIDQILKDTKIFYFKSLYTEGDQASKLEEVDPKDAEVSMRLPLDTIVDKLFIMNGEIMMIDDQENQEV